MIIVIFFMLFYVHAYTFYTHSRRLTRPIIEGKYRGGDIIQKPFKGREDKKNRFCKHKND